MVEVKTAAEIAAERVQQVTSSSGGISVDDYRLFKEDTIRHIKELRTAIKALQRSLDKKQQQ
jgi:hypothetical protein